MVVWSEVMVVTAFGGLEQPTLSRASLYGDDDSVIQAFNSDLFFFLFAMAHVSIVVVLMVATAATT